MSDALNLACTLNTRALPVTDSQRLVYLLLEVSGGTGLASLPVNLALAVDVSESMHVRLANDEQFENLARMGILQEILIDGVPAWRSPDIPEDILARLPRKIDRVKDALEAAVEQLRSADRFSLVAFAGQAVVLIPSTLGTEKDRLIEFVDRVDKLHLGDDTYIGRGMALGLEQLRQDMSPGAVNRLLVLTDGFTLDEGECRTWATQAQQARIPISTMGLGGEFNENLMIPIADQTGGGAYLLENPEDIPAAFAEELQRAQAVRYRNLELKLHPTQDVKARAAYRVRPSIAPLQLVNEGGSYSFPLGDLVPGEEPAVLLELLVPPRQAGMYRLGQALLGCDDPAGGLSGLKTRIDVVAEYAPDPIQAAQVVPQVMHIVEALSAYKLQQRAQADLDAGNIAGATRKLRVAATRLLDLGKDELAAEVEQQVADLEQRGRVDPRRTKKVRYETRTLTQKLKEENLT